VKLKSISNFVTSKVGRQLLHVRKHSPTVMFVAGAVGIVGTVVLASRATLQLDRILNEHEDLIAKTEWMREYHSEQYSEQDQRRDQIVVYTKTTIKFAKLYGPAFLVGVASIAALTGAHVTLNRRYAAVTAAYAGLDKAFRAYRQRVIDDVGPEKELEYRYDMTTKELVRETDEGPVVEEAKQIAKHGTSIYGRFFDELSTSWSRDPGYNQNFLRNVQNYANDLLKARGHVFLNEVYDMLGLSRTKEGQIVGWVLDGGNSDNFIDFGVFRPDNMYEGFRFVCGDEKSIWLDFNVDGPIYDLI